MMRAYEPRVDTTALAELRRLDEDHTLVWMPSHRSYLDMWALPAALDDAGFPPYFVLGGINLDFWPFGDIAKRTGLVFIRRKIRDDPVYRFALRQYLAHLVANHSDFGWSIEGGRTRTGKLRPPRYGLLRYLVDTVRRGGRPRRPAGPGLDRLRHAPGGPRDGGRGARRAQASRGRALAARLRAPPGRPARPRLHRLRRADRAGRSPRRAARRGPRRHARGRADRAAGLPPDQRGHARHPVGGRHDRAARRRPRADARRAGRARRAARGLPRPPRPSRRLRRPLRRPHDDRVDARRAGPRRRRDPLRGRPRAGLVDRPRAAPRRGVLPQLGAALPRRQGDRGGRGRRRRGRARPGRAARGRLARGAAAARPHEVRVLLPAQARLLRRHQPGDRADRQRGGRRDEGRSARAAAVPRVLSRGRRRARHAPRRPGDRRR